jgi:hypothetical protein
MPARRDRCGARTRTRRGPWRAACKPSSVASRCEHRSADGHPSARPTRELSESTCSDPRAGLRSPIRSCSGQSLPRFTPAAAFRPRGHRHCGAGPRLTADGRYPLACSLELGLSSDAAFRPMRPRPSGRLQGRLILPDSNARSTRDHRWSVGSSGAGPRAHCSAGSWRAAMIASAMTPYPSALGWTSSAPMRVSSRSR